MILLQSANLFISVSSGFRSLFSGNLYCLFLVVWSGFCFRILSTKAIKVIIFPSLDQSFHLDINEMKLMKTNQSCESSTTSKEEVGVKSVAMHETDKIEQRFRGCYPVRCVQIGIYRPVRDNMSK